jgi:hypothetical protein
VANSPPPPRAKRPLSPVSQKIKDYAAAKRQRLIDAEIDQAIAQAVRNTVDADVEKPERRAAKADAATAASQKNKPESNRWKPQPKTNGKEEKEEACQPSEMSGVARGRARGVPSVWYTEYLVVRLVKMIAQGYTLRQISNMKGMPELNIMLKWYAEKPEFRQRIEKAKTELVERFAEDILDIADDSANDYMVRVARNGEEIRTVDHENVNRSKLRIETRKWLMSKLRPERYGDNMKIDKKIDIVARVEAMTPQQRIARADQLLEMGRQFLPLLEKVETAAETEEDDG